MPLDVVAIWADTCGRMVRSMCRHLDQAICKGKAAGKYPQWLQMLRATHECGHFHATGTAVVPSSTIEINDDDDVCADAAANVDDHGQPQST